MTKQALIGLLVATGCATATVSAAADDQTTPAQTDQTQSTTTPPKHLVKHAAKKAKQDAKAAVPDHPQAQQPIDSGDAKTPGEAMDKADTSAEKANAQAVGPEQEKSNEAEAQKARPKDDDKEAHDAAKAIGKATTSAADFVATGVEDTTRSTDKPGRYEPFAAEWNPLGAFSGGRISLQLEYVPVTHHAIELSPHFVNTSSDINVDSTNTAHRRLTGFGGEVGYRYYTGHRGPNGVFVGPSLIGGFYGASLPSGNQSFSDIGIAADVGVQTLIADHVVVGGGLGVEYLKVSHDFGDLPSSQAQIATTGVKPRFLLDVGAAF